eukprot:scaffold77798_cov18-Tisochrysis_lutea.AAC.1
MLPGRSSSHIYGRCERGCETMMMWCLHGPVCPVCKGGVCPPRLEIGGGRQGQPCKHHDEAPGV